MAQIKDDQITYLILLCICSYYIQSIRSVFTKSQFFLGDLNFVCSLQPDFEVEFKYMIRSDLYSLIE